MAVALAELYFRLMPAPRIPDRYFLEIAALKRRLSEAADPRDRLLIHAKINEKLREVSDFIAHQQSGQATGEHSEP